MILKVSYSAPANIALIKYWGKTGIQLPANASLSMTLDKSRTITEMELNGESKNKGDWRFTYAGQEQKGFDAKIADFFNRIRPLMPFLNEVFLSINSENNFPHSSGISSSASSMASMALCLCDLEGRYNGKRLSEDAFLMRASEIARLGSGSGSRSVFGGYSIWGTCRIQQASDLYAIAVSEMIHPDFLTYRDAILILNSDSKSLSSTAGHELMNHNIYASSRYTEASEDLDSLIYALKNGDKDLFIRIVEHEALSLHGLIMSSEGGHVLMKPETIKAINIIREYRDRTGSKCCFTMDAGPNVHLLYPSYEKEWIKDFIMEELITICESGRWIDDQVGWGPVKLS